MASKWGHQQRHKGWITVIFCGILVFGVALFLHNEKGGPLESSGANMDVQLQVEQMVDRHMHKMEQEVEALRRR